MAGAAAMRRCFCAGFVRFLDLLARWVWSAQPLVVDPARELSEAQRRTIRDRHAQRRAAGQRVPAMYIVTPRDWDSSNWWVAGL